MTSFSSKVVAESFAVIVAAVAGVDYCEIAARDVGAGAGVGRGCGDGWPALRRDCRLAARSGLRDSARPRKLRRWQRW